jgi:hypothetical protein
MTAWALTRPVRCLIADRGSESSGRRPLAAGPDCLELARMGLFTQLRG